MARPMEAGAAGAGTSGRPWVPSRGSQGRGDQGMRKVITGEQVAQLANRTRSPCPSGAPRCTGPRPGSYWWCSWPGCWAGWSG